jgi:DNA-binding NarL/FixJ family response regulator
MSGPSAVLRTVIASDNFLTREGLGCLLSGARGIEIVARVDSHPETLTAIRRYRPDVLIVGIRTPALTPCPLTAVDLGTANTLVYVCGRGSR